ncbi:hypothetical protein L1286_09475 [Pseudoalteromonas sp. SMS1]|uniref:hypothetical protein n=1 Tax=Pseudoalteromonas sp. SMS1 TaxID=2908894 RepID=UPI001F179864|nr:hypothetical protein [Pseudoalteromonas sp. SMS1]MCF2857700.1 hypothetical protein [Pseudoalteromonas sp. SMS1]
MKPVHFLAASVMFAGNVCALEPIYDADSSAGRTTQYSHGPVNSVSVQTSSAHYIAAFISTNGQASCTSAALFEEAGTTLIAQLQVSENKAVYGGVDAGFEALPKVLKLTCHDSERSFLVHHKVPAAPTIHYERTLKFANWQPAGNRSPGYFAHVTVAPQLAINTSVADGQCHIVEFNATGPKLFNGAAQISGIHSDYFSQSTQTDYHAYSASLIYGIKCSNAGGTTLLVDEWHVAEASQSGSLSTRYY